MCDALLLANIPLDKLRNPFFRKFLEKWTRHTIPDPTTLRDGYIDPIFQAKMAKMREEVGDHPIALCVDETTNKSGECVVNAVVTPLLRDRPGIPRLAHCDTVEQANSGAIVSFVHDALHIIWPDRIHYDRLLIYHTDAARYMKLSGRLLVTDFPKMINVTCLAHLWHRLAEEIRNTYPEANDIISETKKVFRKAPNRVREFREQAPGVLLPPEPILTRWGTWIEAAKYYAAHFPQIADVIAILEPDAQCVVEAQEYFEVPGMEEIFETISNTYGSLVTTIKRLETRGLSLDASINIVEDMYRELDLPLVIPRPIHEKMCNLFEQNEGYNVMKTINRYLETGVRDEELPVWSEADLQAARYAPISSAEVERAVNTYKKIGAIDRQSFTHENLSKHVVLNCFSESL